MSLTCPYYAHFYTLSVAPRKMAQRCSSVSWGAVTPSQRECMYRATISARSAWAAPRQPGWQRAQDERRRQRRRQPWRAAAHDEGSRGEGTLWAGRPQECIPSRFLSWIPRQPCPTARPHPGSGGLPTPCRAPRTPPGSSLATEFQSFLNQRGVPELLRDRQPTHLMSPPACIAAQMDALQARRVPRLLLSWMLVLLVSTTTCTAARLSQGIPACVLCAA